MRTLGTFDNVNVKKGTTNSGSMAIPPDAHFAVINIGRENWPAAGADVYIFVSYDNAVSFVAVALPTKIMPFVPTAKVTAPTPASIGYGWPDNKRPTHMRARCVAPSAFSAKIELKVG